MVKTKRREGFTLIELSLSIIFVAILSLAIVMIILNTVSSYRRGLTLNKVNTLGMDLVDDMRYAIQNAAVKTVTGECTSKFVGGAESGKTAKACADNGARNFVTVTRTANLTIDGKTKNGVPVFGAFCTGSYSYIWNSGYYWAADMIKDELPDKATLKYKVNGGGTSAKEAKDFRMLKVQDDERAVCIAALGNKSMAEKDMNNYMLPSGGIESTFDISGFKALDEEPVEMITWTTADNGEEASGDNNLALYDLSVATPVEGEANNAFYAVSFILGTTDGGIDILAKGQSCKPPEELGSYFDYCAINNFNFAVQAGGV